ncbi:MAG: MerR family transcriptional regulator [Lachnospiraceae bacterium]|nr:MerR family transcriptional regulator [Lachnospiraceae bacterium]
MTIGEIAEKTNLSESTLRYYEKKGLIQVARDENGRRDYEEGDIEWIRFIRRLKETSMLLKDIKQYSELRYCGSSTMPERLEILQKHRAYVLEQQLKWKAYLQNLDDKIEFYQKSMNKTLIYTGGRKD